jgi:DNA-binding NtrC family response regulator/HAMP domain-containing protein
MRFLREQLPDSSFERFRNAIRASSLNTRLIIGLIPPVLIILAITGYLNYSISRDLIGNALERSSKLQVISAKREMESFLERWRVDVSNLSQEIIDADSIYRFLARKGSPEGSGYIGAAYISQKNADHLIFMAKDSHIVQIPPELISEIKPIPLIYYDRVKTLAAGHVWLSPVMVMEHPFPEPAQPNQKVVRKALLMAVPVENGFLLVWVDARTLRNLLSLFNSIESPVWPFPRTAEERYFYLFEPEGWILFQSEALDRPQADLSTYLARSGFTGSLGHQGLESAFRPDTIFERYWKMVADVRAGRSDAFNVTGNQPNAFGRDFFLAYAPVQFRPHPNAAAQVVAGVAFMDISRLPLSAGNKYMDSMLIVAAASALIISGLIVILGRTITRPILKLADAARGISHGREFEPIEMPHCGKEITTLQTAINTLGAELQRQTEEIREKERLIRATLLKELAHLDPAPASTAPGSAHDPIPSIVGYGPRTERLKTEILKAAPTDADVLVIGETGTGKQLTAEAVHRLGNRSDGPFISINCGALDENLLLDTLFGHVKGAFTEAKADRKGAFLEADRGTLFLDEIQAASPRVQQALLRAVSARKIKPLGSDRELEVDVRLIAATNTDLRELIERGLFREDLYFRLKVITIHTPPLREQKENIVVLARHFLALQEKLSGKTGIGLSKGALYKLTDYDWPGNVRELQNCIIRAVVMAEGRVIQAEDIPLDVEEPGGHGPGRSVSLGETMSAEPVPPPGLNSRQQKAYPLILARGRVTRSAYEEMIGGMLPPRTAIYDLQDLVRKGLLRKTGRGPATHYVVVGGKTP